MPNPKTNIIINGKPETIQPIKPTWKHGKSNLQTIVMSQCVIFSFIQKKEDFIGKHD